MIKHRFILPTKDDFKIFAAIPCENTVLTWKKWTRPPDWNALKVVCAEAVEATKDAELCFRAFAEHARDLQEFANNHTGPDSTPGVFELIEQMSSHAEWAEEAGRRVYNSWKELARTVVALPPPEAEQTAALFQRAVLVLSDTLDKDVDPARVLPNLRTAYTKHLDTLARSERDSDRSWRELFKQMRIGFSGMVTRISDVEAVISRRHAFADHLKVLVDSTPLPTTPCPPGVPFAAYTVEWNEATVDVIEGCAWISNRRNMALPIQVLDELRDSAYKKEVVSLEQARTGFNVGADPQTGEVQFSGVSIGNISKYISRDPTDEEKRVVEIVTQMLTERSLNPKADTRVPVREIDPAKAHQTREADRRSTTPAIRTIKFAVTPPRYLREAAERILSSPRRAHWVIGHWRNQPYGERRASRKQMWIKPHIRGLGEASATVAAVVAPRDRERRQRS